MYIKINYIFYYPLGQKPIKGNITFNNIKIENKKNKFWKNIEM